MNAASVLAVGLTARLPSRSTAVRRSVSMPRLVQPAAGGVHGRLHPVGSTAPDARFQVLELTHDAVFLRRRNGAIEYWNPAAEEMYGWTADEAIGSASHELLKTVFPVSLEQIEADLVRRGRWEGEVVHTRKDGAEVIVASRWRLQPDEAAAPVAVLVYEARTVQARPVGAVLAHRDETAARLMRGDTVSAAVAHEFRQPLTAMVASADAGLRFLDRAVPNLDKAKEAFQRIASDGHRAAAVIESIRRNLRTDVDDRTSIDVNALIQQAMSLEEGNLQKHGIVVQSELNTRLPAVAGDPVQLLQVLLNLIGNAIDAMAANENPRVLRVRSEPQEAGDVAITVADSGIGVHPGEADRIFKPLFTTKSHGMGMGLSICLAIVEAHGGRLTYAPNLPRGAMFQFTLHGTSSRAPLQDVAREVRINDALHLTRHAAVRGSNP